VLAHQPPRRGSHSPTSWWCGGQSGYINTPHHRQPNSRIPFQLSCLAPSTLPCSAAAGDQEAEPWSSSDKWLDWAVECTKAAIRGPRGSRRRWRERCSPRAAAGPPPGSTPRPPRVPAAPHRAAFHQVRTTAAPDVVVVGRSFPRSPASGGTGQANVRARAGRGLCHCPFRICSVSQSVSCFIIFLSYCSSSSLQRLVYSHISIRQLHHSRFNHFRIYFMNNEFKKIN
jgi:hypothetical protein